MGKSVVLIEAGKLAGTCLHNGCIATNALLHAGEVADAARDSSQFGVNSTFVSVDMAGVHKYKDGVVGRLFNGIKGLVKARGITRVEGGGKLVSSGTIDVNGTRYRG